MAFSRQLDKYGAEIAGVVFDLQLAGTVVHKMCQRAILIGDVIQVDAIAPDNWQPRTNARKWNSRPLLTWMISRRPYAGQARSMPLIRKPARLWQRRLRDG